MYNSKFPSVEECLNPTKYDGQQAYIYAKRGQVLLAEELAVMEPEVKWVSSHPGWADTPGVDSAFGDQKKYLNPMRNLWQGAEGQAWLCVCDSSKIESGALYLDRKPQRKHLAGWFMGEGTATKNTKEEAQKMIKDLDALAELKLKA
jgi:dehydrogenase/reductase SDR family protein 12